LLLRVVREAAGMVQILVVAAVGLVALEPQPDFL
jgi:hypothetical protein